MNKRKALGAAVAVVVVGVTVVAVVGPRESEPDEIDQLRQVLRLAPGSTVADVGAGDGWLSVAVARQVGPEGHVFATELNPARHDTRDGGGGGSRQTVDRGRGGRARVELTAGLLRRDLHAPRLPPPQ